MRLHARRRDPPALDVVQDVVAHRALAVASVVARPVLRWNHDRRMDDGVRGLEARLARA